MLPLAVATPSPDARLAVVLAVLVAVAALTSRLGGLGVTRDEVTASLRAVVQLSIVAVVIAAVLESVGLSFGFALLMFVVATATSARRVGVPAHQAGWVALAIAAGAAPVIGLVLGSGVVPLEGVGVIPIAGIVIGGAMTACTLTGRRAFAELTAQHGAREAALALGLREHEAVLLVTLPTAKEALTPGLDQTRTVGLVALPGAFVGVLLGGGTALEAGAAQVLVLVGLLAAQAITSTTLLRLVAWGRVHRPTAPSSRR